METLNFEYEAKRPLQRRAHVGQSALSDDADGRRLLTPQSPRGSPTARSASRQLSSGRSLLRLRSFRRLHQACLDRPQAKRSLGLRQRRHPRAH